jgi:hypothetical protein
MWVWIDPKSAEIIDSGIHQTCVKDGDCVHHRPIDGGGLNNAINSQITANGSITLTYGLICNGPGWYEDIRCVFRAGGELRFLLSDDRISWSGTVTKFPNVEAYYWEDEENAVELFTENFFTEDEVNQGTANPQTAFGMLSVTSFAGSWKISQFDEGTPFYYSNY